MKSDTRDVAAAKVGVSGKVVDLAEETAESRQIYLAGWIKADCFPALRGDQLRECQVKAN